MAIGYAAWIDEQLAKPATSHRAYWEAADAAYPGCQPGSNAWQDQVFESFWKQALSGEDQLRQRMAFYALSQIFVISMQDGSVATNRARRGGLAGHARRQGLGRYATCSRRCRAIR